MMDKEIEERIEYWTRRYKLEDLKLAGYRGGYPIFSFKRKDEYALNYMSKRELNKIIRSAETFGGIDLGVGWNFRKTAFVTIEGETIVINGHIYVVDRILEKIFNN